MMMTTEQKAFLGACHQCAVAAKEENQQLFVMKYATTFFITADFDKHWLFRAFLGGRKVFSLRGRSIIENLVKGIDYDEEDW